ncbi:molybdopterin converting factor subunit 1 [Paenibacillus sp. N1-5-1-14]|uniref:molybdopterin converting factor subunit 1 n=1 Tax=Paenibacillus radicibacter TaxID=2972488 RepID=UPI002158D6BA|nr:molybdopterin converting factor subunit 1 [Paenibacillus radicibacter]MCR8641789.1 molybdopterin converting factor subunit 1 [Paenibacillus radicibacter]
MIKVLLFARMREVVGDAQVLIDQDRMTIQELKQHMSERFGLQEQEVMMVAVNEKFADDQQVVKRGEVVAFIPPVSGG